MLETYRPHVEASAVSFECEVPSLDAFGARVSKALADWQWLVAERDGQVLGYAYGSMHRDRPAYRWSVEVSAYVSAEHHHRGIGRSLYLQLFHDLATIGYCNPYAGVTLPYAASVCLHQAVGFVPIGVFTSVGHKFGKWHDVAWFQRSLRDSPPE